MKSAHLIVIAIGGLLAGMPIGMVRAANADVVITHRDPAWHWVYKAINDMQEAGIVIGYPEGSYSGFPPMTRMQMATSIARLLVLLKTDTVPSDGLAAARADLHSKLDNNAIAIDAAKQLVDGFAPELSSLGQDVPAAKAELDSLEAKLAAANYAKREADMKFAGVPPSHWAYNAVETLYKRGIVVGYPAGSY